MSVQSAADGMPGGGKESQREDGSWVEMGYVYVHMVDGKGVQGNVSWRLIRRS